MPQCAALRCYKDTEPHQHLADGTPCSTQGLDGLIGTRALKAKANPPYIQMGDGRFSPAHGAPNDRWHINA